MEQVPTHKQLEDLPIFKEIRKAFRDATWITGERAYANGTRCLQLTNRDISRFWFYPYKGRIIHGSGTLTNVDMEELSGWDEALFRVLKYALSNYYHDDKVSLKFSDETFERLISSRRDIGTVRFLSGNENTPIDVLRAISKKFGIRNGNAENFDQIIFERLVMNPSSPMDVIRELILNLESVRDVVHMIGWRDTIIPAVSSLIRRRELDTDVVFAITKLNDPTLNRELEENPNTAEIIKSLSNWRLI